MLLFRKTNLLLKTHSLLSYKLEQTLQTIPANITKLLNINKTNFLSPPPLAVQCCEQPETTFGNIPWHKFNIDLEKRGLKKGNMIQHGVYHNNMRIFYRGKYSRNQLCPRL
jgi:hypothetical protein